MSGGVDGAEKRRTACCLIAWQRTGLLFRGHYFKLENPYGQRIQRVFAGEDEVAPDKTYRVAYVTPQAVPQKVGRQHRETGTHAVFAMEQLLKTGPYDRKNLEGYIPV